MYEESSAKFSIELWETTKTNNKKKQHQNNTEDRQWCTVQSELWHSYFSLVRVLACRRDVSFAEISAPEHTFRATAVSFGSWVLLLWQTIHQIFPRYFVTLLGISGSSCRAVSTATQHHCLARVKSSTISPCLYLHTYIAHLCTWAHPGLFYMKLQRVAELDGCWK